MVDNPALDAIFNRRSVPRLVAPAPGAQEVDILLQAAHSAPDHHHCTPFRAILITDNLKARLIEIASTGEDRVVAERKMSRAPLIIAAIYSPTPESRTPATEQRDSAAASVENLLIAATALGIGSIWRTGALAYSPLAHKVLGLNEYEQIMGWIYLGSVPNQ